MLTRYWLLLAVQIDLSDNALCGIEFGQGTYTADGIKAIAEAISVSASLTSVNLLKNGLGTEAASMLLKVKEEKPMLRTLCGLTHAETELSYDGELSGPADVMLLAPEISVMASVTSVCANIGW